MNTDSGKTSDNFELSNSHQKVDLFQKHRSLEALLNFVGQVNELSSLEDAIWHLAHHTIKALNFEDCVIYLLDDDQITLKQVAAFGPKNPQRYHILNPILLRVGQGIVGNAAKQLKSIRIDNTQDYPDYIIDDSNRLSELAIPISFQNKLLGVIDSEHSQAGFFTKEHQRYVEILASVLASKITFESNINQLEKSISDLENSQKLSETYLKISELTYKSNTLEEFYLNLHQLIIKQVHTHSFFVVLYDSQKQQYTLPYVHDEKNGGKFDPIFDNHQIKNSLIAEVITTQKPLLADHKELIKRSIEGRLLHKGKIAFCWLGVPFWISNNLSGAIALQSYDEEITFNKQDKEFLTFLGQHISTAIERKLKDQKLNYQALHDNVTGLANRSLFLDRINHAFSRVNRSYHSELAVLFIDFDDFKLINDNYGHQAGDQVLKETACRMQTQLREADTLARLGGDEFAILLEDMEDESFVITIANRLLEVMRQPIIINKQSIFVGISIGIALKDQHTDSAEDLLKNADHAMYHVKRKGKNNIQIYESSLHQSVVYARQILQELEVAIKSEQLLIYFQPIAHLASNKVVGFEALMRWKHPTRGIINPSEFIVIAEENDLIRAIDRQLLKNVAEQLQRWQKKSHAPLYVSVNISAQRFADSHLIDEIKDVMQKYQLRPGSIIIELTEHIMMENINKARHLFHRLKQLGIKVSLDDFGTGHSSLSYLSQLPFDIIKIDRSFISQIKSENSETPIINTIVALAKILKMELIAEGIETKSQLKLLNSINCDFGQGYYLSPPLPVASAEKYVLNRNINQAELGIRRASLT